MHKGKRLFITGIPTSGKSFLAKQLAQKLGGIAICLDDIREELGKSEPYKKWVNFYSDQDEKEYLTQTSPEELWNNLVRQSEALWPALLEKIDSYTDEPKPVIFESVNILPHLAKQDLDFPGIVLLGTSYETTLKRNQKDPRWGNTQELQELEAKTFWEIERPQYKKQAKKFSYSFFKSGSDAFVPALKLMGQPTALYIMFGGN